MAVERVGDTGNIETLRTTADAGGGFEFMEVPPGRYVVGVDLTRRMAPKVAFPTTFHPGTSSPAQATIVQVTGGQHVELRPMSVPEPRRRLRLAGRVLFENGSAAGGASVSLWDGLARWRQVALGIRTAPDGTFEFDVHAGLSYSAQASYYNRDQPDVKQVSQRSDSFVVSEDTMITIVLPRRE